MRKSWQLLVVEVVVVVEVVEEVVLVVEQLLEVEQLGLLRLRLLLTCAVER